VSSSATALASGRDGASRSNLAGDQRVAFEASSQGFSKTCPLPVGAGQPVVDVNPVGGHRVPRGRSTRFATTAPLTPQEDRRRGTRGWRLSELDICPAGGDILKAAEQTCRFGAGNVGESALLVETAGRFVDCVDDDVPGGD
jgi:hypothetical protein